MIRPAREIDEHTPWQEMTLGGEVYEPATPWGLAANL